MATFLEYAGLITYEGKRVMCHMCEYIKDHSEELKQRFRDEGWKV